MVAFYAIIALCLFGGALADTAKFGPCPNVEVIQDLDIDKYMGQWYEIEKYFMLAEFGASCVTADYSPGENNTIKMVNSYKNLLGMKASVEAVARIPDESQPGKLKVKYGMMPLDIEGDYWILGTDYESFAVVYSCRNLIFTNTKHAWILTREQDPSEEILAKAYAVTDKAQLKRSLFIKTKQTDCE